MDAKQCVKCDETLPTSMFSPHRRMRDGLQSYCKPCSRNWHHEHPEYVKRKGLEWRRKNPDYARKWQRMNKLGASPSWVDEQLSKQSNKCAGCLCDFSEIREYVDHSHVTGKLRGLLCNDCNLVLGRARDSIETLRRLADYLAEAEAY